MATEPLSLMEFVHALLADAALRSLFADDPRATLAAHGLGDLAPVDVHDALDLVQDNEITDFHAEPSSWDLDTEAFGHGGAAASTADHAWHGIEEPTGGTWTDWAPSENTGTSSENSWADDGYGSGHDIAVDLGPDAGSDVPGLDLHHG